MYNIDLAGSVRLNFMELKKKASRRRTSSDLTEMKGKEIMRVQLCKHIPRFLPILQHSNSQ